MESDRFAIRTVVVVLGAVVLAVAVGELVLAFVHTSIPDSVDRLGFAALGAISGILAKTSSTGATPSDPVPVAVVQPPGEPVPTTDVTLEGEAIDDGDDVGRRRPLIGR